MKRDVESITDREFDVLIVGGGIHGAAIARECSCLGMRVLLVEREDFGHATSANSLKIVHGGLRYLQHLNIKRMRDSILARREMMRLAPQYVKPLGCIIPNAGRGVRGNFFMRLALLVNDMVGWDRNAGVPEGCRLPPGRVLSLEESRKLLPGVDVDGVKGASLWYDGLAENSERLTLSFVQAAVDCGARVLNHVSLKKVFSAEGGVTGGLLYDELNGEEVTVRAQSIVNAGGPWIDNVNGQGDAGSDSPRPGKWAKAVNIIVRKSFFGPYAVGLAGDRKFEDKDAFIRKKGRFFFFVPWRGYTMIGTTYKPYSGSPGQVQPDVEDIAELVDEVNMIYPAAELTIQDVTNVHAGLVPMTAAIEEPDEDVQLVKESLCIDHGAVQDGLRGFFTIKGVKYTTAPRVAAETGKAVGRHLGRGNTLPGTRASKSSRINDQKRTQKKLPPDFRYLRDRYGDRAAIVYEYVRQADEIVIEEPCLHMGEIDYFIEEEMACTLADVVFRRSGAATAECPDRDVLAKIARRMAMQLGWDSERQDREIGKVAAHFAPLAQAKYNASGSADKKN